MVWVYSAKFLGITHLSFSKCLDKLVKSRSCSNKKFFQQEVVLTSSQSSAKVPSKHKPGSKYNNLWIRVVAESWAAQAHVASLVAAQVLILTLSLLKYVNNMRHWEVVQKRHPSKWRFVNFCPFCDLRPDCILRSQVPQPTCFWKLVGGTNP